MFGVDTDQGCLHLHGAFDAVPEMLPAVRTAMKKAWGEQKGPGSQFQVDIKSVCSEGWAGYLTRNQRRVSPIIGETVSDASELINAGWARNDLEAMEVIAMGMGCCHSIEGQAAHC